MIGTKKLSTVRQELEKGFSSGGADPIQWLAKKIAAANRKGGSTEVLEGLKQFLESAPKRKPRKRRVATKQ